jgi:hypothetical protein
VIHLCARHAQRSAVVHDQQLTGPAARAAGPVFDRRDHQEFSAAAGHNGKNYNSNDRPSIGPIGATSFELVATVAGNKSQAALWSEVNRSPSSAPERLLLDAIAAGELDEHLVALADAVHARRALLHTVRSATAIAELCVGDPVRINRNVRPGYLYGEHGVIVDLDDHAVTVRLLRPVGRFRSGELRCPPLALDKLDRTTWQPAT